MLISISCRKYPRIKVYRSEMYLILPPWRRYVNLVKQQRIIELGWSMWEKEIGNATVRESIGIAISIRELRGRWFVGKLLLVARNVTPGLNMSHTTAMPSTTLVSNCSFNESDCVEEVFIPYNVRPETYIVPVVFLIILIVGVAGNGALVLTLLRHANMRNVPNTYVLSLALGDLLVRYLIEIPKTLLPEFGYSLRDEFSNINL